MSGFCAVIWVKLVVKKKLRNPLEKGYAQYEKKAEKAFTPGPEGQRGVLPAHGPPAGVHFHFQLSAHVRPGHRLPELQRGQALLWGGGRVGGAKAFREVCELLLLPQNPEKHRRLKPDGPVYGLLGAHCLRPGGKRDTKRQVPQVHPDRELYAELHLHSGGGGDVPLLHCQRRNNHPVPGASGDTGKVP